MDKLDNLNPCHASNEPNPFFGAKKQPGRGNGFENSPRLHLVDSGMANNCPQHVFMHVCRPPLDHCVRNRSFADPSPSLLRTAGSRRRRDFAASPALLCQAPQPLILIFNRFDASSDVQKDAATDRINEYGSTRGMTFTPRVALPPLCPPVTDAKGNVEDSTPEEIKERFQGR